MARKRPAKRCGATTKSGKPCPMPPWCPSAARCLQHDDSEAARAKRHEARSKGGLARRKVAAPSPSGQAAEGSGDPATPPAAPAPPPLVLGELGEQPPADLPALRGLLSRLLVGAATGQLPEKRAHACAALAGQLVKALSADRPAAGFDEQEQRARVELRELFRSMGLVLGSPVGPEQ